MVLEFCDKWEGLWKSVMRGKYKAKDEGWCTREVRDGHGVGMWVAIRRVEFSAVQVGFCGEVWEKGEFPNE